MICPTCGTEFDPADRASPEATDGAVDQIKYCSERCARKAENRRHYLRHREEVIRKNIERQRKGN